MYKCRECGEYFTIRQGILAEIKDGRVVMGDCSPFTNITALCNKCVEKLGIITEIEETLK